VSLRPGVTRSPNTSTRSTNCNDGSARSDRELAPIARSDARAQSAADDPRRRTADRPHLRFGDRRRLSLRIGRKARRLCRACTADHSVGRALGDRAPVKGGLADASLPRSRPLTKPGGRLITFHEHYRRLAANHGTNPAKVSLARKLLICSWHMQDRSSHAPDQRAPRRAPAAFRPPDGPAWLRGRGSSQDHSAPECRKRNELDSTNWERSKAVMPQG
jgi:hypothetical protein